MMVNHLNTFLNLCLIAAGESSQHQVLVNAQLRKNPTSLRHMSKSLLHKSMSRHMSDFLAVIENMSGTGRNQAGDGLQRGGLAGAVRTDKRHDLALFHMEGDALQRLNDAVIYIQILYIQNCTHLFLLNRRDMP